MFDNPRILSRFAPVNQSFLLGALLCLGSIATLGAQEIPADAVLQGFEPTGSYILEIDGTEDPDALLFEAQKAGSVLLIKSSSFAGPVLLTPRSRTVEIVPSAKVVEREDGRVDILSDAEMAPEGEFTVESSQVVFTIGETEGRLVERPYLLGHQTTEALLDYDPTYSFRASHYKPSGPMIRSLNAVESPVRVRVFFGSWCPHCKEMVPRLLSVAQVLEGSQLAFEYYGLPRPFGDDTEAAQANINAVPTAVVYQGGNEIGRIEGGSWKIPELALKRLLQ